MSLQLAVAWWLGNNASWPVLLLTAYGVVSCVGAIGGGNGRQILRRGVLWSCVPRRARMLSTPWEIVATE